MKYPLIFIPGLIVGHKLYEWMKVKDYVKSKIPHFYIHARERGMALDERANWLARIIEANFEHFKKVHLFGHSAGGLDARLALHLYPRLRDKVATVTTCGTPHHGTIIADMWLEKFESVEIDEMLTGNEKVEQIIREFTPAYMKEFNLRVDSEREIKNIYAIPCAIGKKWKAGFSSWKGYDCLREAQYGLNDGTVPVSSQAYGDTVAVVENDHKSATLPFRYGFSCKGYRNTFDTLIDHLKRTGEK